MILHTNLKHVVDGAEYEATLKENENVMICCGRMGPMCIPVYQSMIELESRYPHIAFRDMAFDAPDAHLIRNLPECRGFMGLPFTVYYKNGKVVAATSSIQTREQIQEILDREFDGVSRSTAV
jgi:thioredoxin 1